MNDQPIQERGGPYPWEQLPDESNKDFARFERYKLLGPNRTPYTAYRQEREEKARGGAQKRAGLPRSWANAVAKYNWKARAEAWDEAQRRETESRWKERSERLREREWALSEKLIDKAEQMLVFPLANTETTTVATENQTRVITKVMPARWGMGDAARIMEAASRIGRLATGLETSHDVVAQVATITPDELAKARAALIAWEAATFGSADNTSPASSENPNPDAT